MFLHTFFLWFFFMYFLSNSLGLASIKNYFFHIIFNQIFGFTFTKFILLISPRNAISDFQFVLNWSISLHLPTFWNHRGIFVVTSHLILEFSVLRRLVTYFTGFELGSCVQLNSSKGILRIASLFDQIENILGLRSIIFYSLNRLNVIYILVRHHLLLSVHSATATSSSSFHLNLWLLLIRILSLQIM